MLPATDQGVMFTRPGVEGSRIMEWLVAPSEHGLGQCPIKAKARTTIQDVPRGALVDVIPQLKTAQNFMARHLDDLQANIYAPVVLDNIKNPHEYGLGAVLVGTGEGKAFIDRDRPPVNFEAQQTIAQIMESARRVAMEPAQRSGEPGAAIVSAKGTIALMGTFNAELAASQGKIENLLTELTSVTAAFDEQWCKGSKAIWVLDQNGRMEDEVYSPETLFNGDHRFRVTYGDRTGLDENQHTTRVAMVKQLGGMSDRTFMQKTGIVDDVLDEETEMFISKMMMLVADQFIPQEFIAGRRDAALKIWQAIDTDSKTARQAVLEMLEELAPPPADPAAIDPTSPQGRADTLLMARSLASGGIPGNAEGLPAPPGGPGEGLPPAARRMANQIGPGGTAT
jgi:hypothetical protein